MIKVETIKSYGTCGKKVTVGLMDCYEASHLVERISLITSNKEERESGIISLNPDGIEEALTLLEMSKNFLSRIALKPEEMPNIFLPEEDEPVKDKEC